MNKTRIVLLSIALSASILIIAYDKILLPAAAKIHPEFAAKEYFYLLKNKAKAQSISEDILKVWIDSESENLVLIDLRNQHEYQQKKIENSFLLPYDELEHTDKSIFNRPDKKIVFISDNGQLAAYVCLKLQNEKIKNLWYLEKGIDNWK